MTDYDLLAQIAYDKLNPEKKAGNKRRESDALAWERADRFVPHLKVEDVTGMNAHALTAFFAMNGQVRR